MVIPGWRTRLFAAKSLFPAGDMSLFATKSSFPAGGLVFLQQNHHSRLAGLVSCNKIVIPGGADLFFIAENISQFHGLAYQVDGTFSLDDPIR
ncbi:MAG: hypothetical protein H6632_21105 [Anaerolineales bacterium]|nr:hypothetical protein [Anaerolineales bacterium]